MYRPPYLQSTDAESVTNSLSILCSAILNTDSEETCYVASTAFLKECSFENLVELIEKFKNEIIWHEKLISEHKVSAVHSLNLKEENEKRNFFYLREEIQFLMLLNSMLQQVKSECANLAKEEYYVASNLVNVFNGQGDSCNIDIDETGNLIADESC